MFYKSDTRTLTFIKRKEKGILLPYFSFGLINYLVWLLRHRNEMSLTPLLNMLWINNNSGLPIAGALWFLTASFYSIMIFYIITSYVPHKRMQNVLIILISLFGCLCRMLLPFTLPWSLDAAFVGVGFVKLGRMTQENRSKHSIEYILNLKPLILFGVAVITTMLILLNQPVNMRTGAYGIIPLFWLNAILTIIVGINISKYFVRLVPKWLWNRIAYVGRYSVVFLGLNQLVILYLKEITTYMNMPILLSKIFIFIVSIPFLYDCIVAITKTKLKVIIGK